MPTKFAELQNRLPGLMLVVIYVVALIFSVVATAYFAPLPRPIIGWCRDCSDPPVKTGRVQLPPRGAVTSLLVPPVRSTQAPALGSAAH
jgi:hypothetical protein